MAKGNVQMGEMSDDERSRIRKLLPTIPDQGEHPTGVTWSPELPEESGDSIPG
jgi:hypothetical protein